MIHRLIICLVALMSYMVCSADTTCKISENGDTVEVYSAILDQPNNVVNVSLGNDSNDNAANVTVTIEVDYYGLTRTYKESTLVLPREKVELPIRISATVNDRSPRSVEVVSVTGTKCKTQ